MNKNTIIAFLIILGSVIFFTSPTYNKFYIEKILRKNYYKQKDITENNKAIKEERKQEKKQKIENESLVDTISVVEKTKNNGDTIWIENSEMMVGIKEKGALITSIEMKEYKQDEKYIDLIEGNKDGGAQLTIGNIKYDNKMFSFKGKSKKIKVEKEYYKAEFIYKDTGGVEIKKIFVFYRNGYEIKIIIEKNDLPGERMSIGWYCGIEESEKIKQKNQIEKEIIHLFNGNNVQHLIMKKEGKEETTGRYKWIGVTSKYFFIALNNDSLTDTDIKIETINENKEKSFNYKIEISKIAEKQEEQIKLYTGPKKRDELKKFNNSYEKVLFPVIGWTKVFFWSDVWFPWLAEMVLVLLLSIQKIVKDYGIAILILTIITRIVTYPMTLSSLKSMEKMKDIQPKVNKIRQKHKNSPQKMNEEIMALYKKEGVNPLNPGCLPMFLQMPVFISLFVVLRKSIEIRGENTILIPWVKDLSKPEVLISLEKIIPNGIPLYGSSIALLPIIMALITFYQQKMTIKDPNQKAMIYFMPIFMLVLFNSFPSGLVLYWTFSSALQLLQQIFMNKREKVVSRETKK